MGVNGKACTIGKIRFLTIKDIVRVPLEGTFLPLGCDPPELDSSGFTHVVLVCNLSFNSLPFPVSLLPSPFYSSTHGVAAFILDDLADSDTGRIVLVYRKVSSPADSVTLISTSDGLDIPPKQATYEDPEVWFQDGSSQVMK